MKKKLLTISILCFLAGTLLAQVPFAFRYQASVRDKQNKPVNESVEFQINLFADDEAIVEIYSEMHTVKPDTNGLVAFSIGEGMTSQDFSAIEWAEGPFYIQVLLDNEEVSYSQLVSVPYAMHAQTAGKIHNLQEPVLNNDPTTKSYVDQSDSELLDSLSNTIAASNSATIDSLFNTILSTNSATIDSLSKALAEALALANAYADSLAITPKDLEVASSGDTLVIGGTQLVIAGMSSQNSEKYTSQLLLGGSYNESLNTIVTCQDSSFLLMGTTLSGNGDVQNFKGEADIWLIKLSKTLSLEWTKTLGGSAYDNGVLLLEENDGYLIGATSESADGDVSENNGEFDIWLVKIDKSGNIVWENTYGGAGTEFINAIIPKDDDSYYIGATTFSNGGDINYLNGESDIWLFKIDDTREISATITIGGSSFDALSTMQKNNSGDLILYGSSSSNDGNIVNNNGALDFIKITLDNDLNIQEQLCIGDASNQQLQLVSVDHNIMAGHSFSENWSVGQGNAIKNIYLHKAGSNGFSLSYGGSNSDIIKDMVIINDTITILAQSSSQDGDISYAKGARDFWLLQISPEGKIIKETNLGGTYDDSPKVLKYLPDNSWLIAGNSESFDGNLDNNSGEKDIWLLKTDHDFQVLWQKNYGGSYNENLNDIHIIDAKNFIIFGTSSSNDYGLTGLHDKAGKSDDIWVLKTQID